MSDVAGKSAPSLRAPFDTARLGGWLALGVVLAFSAGVLGTFVDRSWYAPDDGAYAYVASRILDGAVLNRDIQDVHAGTINFVNALALRLFGDALVSLRYPLVALGILQAVLVFLMMRARGLVPAVAGAVALTALSFVQFLNPTPHWYNLFLVIAVAGVLAAVPRDRRWRIFAVGFLVMTVFLFRQLTGVVVGVAVVSYLLQEAADGDRGGGMVARAMCAVMALGVAAYVLVKTNVLAAPLFAAAPLAILVWQALRVRVADGVAVGVTLRLAAGAVVASLPLLLYHLGHGSLGSWYDDVVGSAVGLVGLDFIKSISYLFLVVRGAAGIVGFASFATVANGLFWVVLPLLPAVLGAIVLARVAGRRPVHPLPYLATFYAIVSLHFQIPIYLFYTAGLTVVGLLCVLAGPAPGRRFVPAGAVIVLASLALVYQAGQPLSRGAAGILGGQRVALVPAPGLDRAGIRMEPEEARLYGELIGLVRAEVPPGETILALPADPQLYYLTERDSALRFFNSAIGIRDDAELSRALALLERAPPRLVFFRSQDKYNNFASAGLMAFVMRRYDRIAVIGDFEIYRSRPADPNETRD